MERERIRSRAGLAVRRSPGLMGRDGTPSAQPRERRGPSLHWSGLQGILAALPRVFATPARDRASSGRGIATNPGRSTFDGGAA